MGLKNDRTLQPFATIAHYHHDTSRAASRVGHPGSCAMLHFAGPNSPEPAGPSAGRSQWEVHGLGAGDKRETWQLAARLLALRIAIISAVILEQLQ